MAIRTVKPGRVKGILLSGMIMGYFCYMQLSIALGFAGHEQLFFFARTFEKTNEALLLLTWTVFQVVL
jgi:hypothetical protein